MKPKVTIWVFFLFESAASTWCNCDANDNVWREDAGTLREIPYLLPIIEVKATDISIGSQMAKVTVGPLTCYEGQWMNNHHISANYAQK